MVENSGAGSEAPAVDKSVCPAAGIQQAGSAESDGPLTLAELFHEIAAQKPDAPAILSPGRVPLTFFDLNRQIARVRADLNQLGFGRHDRIALICSPAVEAVVAFICIGSAATVTPLDAKASLKEHKELLSSSGADAVVISDDLEEVRAAARAVGVPALRLLPRLEREAGVFDLSGEDLERTGRSGPADGSAAAVIYLTSGTAGRPKAVPLSQAQVMRRAYCEANALGLTAEDRCLTFRDAHLQGTLNGSVLAPLCVGGSVVVTDGFDADDFFLQLKALQFTWYTGGPVYHEAIVERAPHYQEIIEQSPLRLVRSATYPLPATLMQDLENTLGVVCLERYGGTEAGLITCNPPPPGRRKAGTAGRPFDVEVQVVDETGGFVPEGEEGEIAVRGPNVFTGYLDHPAGERPILVDGWYRTGDLGRFDPDGYLTVTGRIREIINRGGQKVSPFQVEAAIKDHPAVGDCVCFPVPHQTLGETVGAVITLRNGRSVEEAEIQEFLKDRFSDFKIPDRIIACDDIPHGPGGKISRVRMAEHFGLAQGMPPGPEDGTGRQERPQRSALLMTLSALWCDVLKVDRIEDDNNFVLLGGDSLRAARLLAKVEEVCGVTLPADIIYRKGRTLAGMADAISQAAKDLIGPQRSSTDHEQDRIPKRDASRSCPLTFSQQRIWFLSKFDPDVNLYNLPVAVRLKGPIDPGVLAKALNAVVARHEVLRASFPEVDGMPQQVFAPTLVLDLPVTDLRSGPGGEREDELKRLIYRETAQPFCLARGPLIRSRLVLLAEQESALLLPQHHLITDGISTEIFFSELMKCYGDLVRDDGPSLPPLPIQFGDYSAWQEGRLQGDKLERLRRHWMSYLDGAPLVLDLPVDRPRPAVQSYSGSRIWIKIPESVVGGLKTVSARSGASLFHCFLAAFQALLHHLTGQDDLLIGTAINNRKQGLTDALMGFFVDTLPLRAHFNDDLTFSQHLRAVCEAAVEAQEYSDMPFEQIVEAINPPRDTGCQPIVQVLFGFATRNRRAFEHRGIAFERIDVDMRASRFDLSVMMSEDGSGMEGFVEYRTDLFDHETISRFVEMFQRLLAQIVEAPDRRIADFQLVSEEEIATLLGDWSGTTVPYPSDKNIPLLFREMAVQYPKAPALVNGDRTITYRELEVWSDRLAHRLTEAGIGPGGVVAISAERRPGLIAGMLGILKAGGAYLALDAALPADRVMLMLDDSEVSVCLIQEGSQLAAALEGVATIELIEGGKNLKDPLRPPNIASIPSHGLAYISFTSGSTGQPKGVCVPHRAVLRLVKNNDYAYFGRDERVLQLASVAFDASTFEVWGCLLNGGTLVQVPTETPTLSELAAVIQDARITTLWLTAGLFHQMVEHELPCFRNVRQLLAGGDVLSPSHVRRFINGTPDCRLINGYGPTENTTFTTAYAVEEGGSFASSVPIGRPIANTRVYILDKKLNPVPVGVVGELYAAGDGLALGYLNRPELTAECFVLNPFDPMPGAKMYRTGDRVRFLRNGLIEFIGRADDQVKVRGFRIEPGEVEAILSEHPDLEQVAVGAGKDAQGATTLIAYLVCRYGAEPLSSRDVRSFLTARLPSYMVPSKFVSLDKIPLTKNGKVDRNRLQRSSEVEGDQVEGPILPRTPVEQILGDIWCDLLGVEVISIEDNFFQLGGHSLLATQLVHRISQEIQEDLPLSAVFQNPTIRTLALQITERMLAAVSENKSEGLGAP